MIKPTSCKNKSASIGNIFTHECIMLTATDKGHIFTISEPIPTKKKAGNPPGPRPRKLTYKLTTEW